MKGTPYIYQGEEIGMTNVSGLRIEDYQDIVSVNFAEDRKKEGWEEEKIRTYLARNSRDHARTPLAGAWAAGRRERERRRAASSRS